MTRIARMERDGKQAGFVRISNLPREKMRTSEPPHKARSFASSVW